MSIPTKKLDDVLNDYSNVSLFASMGGLFAHWEVHGIPQDLYYEEVDPNKGGNIMYRGVHIADAVFVSEQDMPDPQWTMDLSFTLKKSFPNTQCVYVISTGNFHELVKKSSSFDQKYVLITERSPALASITLSQLFMLPSGNSSSAMYSDAYSVISMAMQLEGYRNALQQIGAHDDMSFMEGCLVMFSKKQSVKSLGLQIKTFGYEPYITDIWRVKKASSISKIKGKNEKEVDILKHVINLALPHPRGASLKETADNLMIYLAFEIPERYVKIAPSILDTSKELPPSSDGEKYTLSKLVEIFKFHQEMSYQVRSIGPTGGPIYEMKSFGNTMHPKYPQSQDNGNNSILPLPNQETVQLDRDGNIYIEPTMDEYKKMLEDYQVNDRISEEIRIMARRAITSSIPALSGEESLDKLLTRVETKIGHLQQLIRRYTVRNGLEYEKCRPLLEEFYPEIVGSPVVFVLVKYDILSYKLNNRREGNVSYGGMVFTHYEDIDGKRFFVTEAGDKLSTSDLLSRGLQVIKHHIVDGTSLSNYNEKDQTVYVYDTKYGTEVKNVDLIKVIIPCNFEAGLEEVVLMSNVLSVIRLYILRRLA